MQRREERGLTCDVAKTRTSQAVGAENLQFRCETLDDMSELFEAGARDAARPVLRLVPVNTLLYGEEGY